MAMITYPLNDVQYSAEDAGLFHCTRTSGIWVEDSFQISATGADNSISIGTGVGWISNEKFWGKVFALKEAETLDLGIADAAYPRIDVVAVQFDATANETKLIVKNGVPSSTPLMPDIIQTESVYELYLCKVLRPAGSIVVSLSNITDTRLDPVLCGLMADSVTKIDTNLINSQVMALLEELQNDLENVKNESDVMLASEWATDGAIAIEKGGTGATTAEEALANLGAYNLNKSIKNYLDNSNFANPVNQRGKTQYAGGGFTIDRWFTTSLNCLVTVNDGFIRMSNYTASSETTNQTLKQKIETKGIAGKRMTLVAKLKGTEVALYIDTIATTSYAEYSDWTTLCLPFTVPEDADIIEIDIRGREGSTWDCEWIALYEGEFTPETAPPYIPKGYAAELMECYRYFYKATSYVAMPGYVTSAAYGWISIPVKMRAVPTVTWFYGSGSDLHIYYDGKRFKNPVFTGVIMTGAMVRFTFEKPSDLTQYADFNIVTSEGGFELSADL